MEPLSEIPLPPDPPRDLEDQIEDLIQVNKQLKEKLDKYGRNDQV